MGLHKLLRIVAIVLGILGAVFMALIWTGSESGINGLAYTAYITLGIVLVLVLIFVLKGIFEGNIKKTLISIGAFLVVVAVSYGLATGTEQLLQDGTTLSEGGSRWVGAGLYTFYILAIVAIGSMVLSGFKKLTSR
ncbi:MAG: hypothetical protein HKO54_12045 [Flavobacteriaceae bacterium]|nr:hypothetical protein [Flavobacteriaceae bacterium]